MQKTKAFPCLRILRWSLLLPLIIGACTPAGGKLRVMEGSFYSSRALYTEAVAAYWEARQFPEALPYAEYGLGTVYLALREDAAALQRFTAAADALRGKAGRGDRELLYRISYNSGVVRFQGGDYPGAAAEFRRALEIDGGRREAKWNLELSLLSIETQRNFAGASALIPAESGRGGSDTLFDYVRQKEREQWRSQEWIEDAPGSGPDY